MNQKDRRKKRVRAKIKGTASKPRLSVFRSHQHIYVQLIDDEKGATLVSVSGKDLTKEDKKLAKSKRAHLIGQALAKKAKTKKINQVVFDRGAFAYHGRVKSLAEGARQGGLKF